MQDLTQDLLDRHDPKILDARSEIWPRIAKLIDLLAIIFQVKIDDD